jgi:hypothetical protein
MKKTEQLEKEIKELSEDLDKLYAENIIWNLMTLTAAQECFWRDRSGSGWTIDEDAESMLQRKEKKDYRWGFWEGGKDWHLIREPLRYRLRVHQDAACYDYTRYITTSQDLLEQLDKDIWRMWESGKHKYRHQHDIPRADMAEEELGHHNDLARNTKKYLGL